MGVRGLTTFVALCRLSEQKTKRYQAADKGKMKIVVDGYALLYYVYFSKKLDFMSGGQFDQLEYELTQFIQALVRAGFAPYIIMDGIHPDIKFHENISRQISTVASIASHMNSMDLAPHRQITHNPVLPLLAERVLIHVLNQLKVPFSVSDDEADAVAGTHANNNGCAVLSKDSDFYVFNVHQGYIPLDSVRVFSDRLTFDHYKIEALTDKLKIPAHMLPAFASLCGNDFVSRECLWGFHMRLRKEIPPTALTGYPDSRCYDIARVGKFVSRYSTQEEAFSAAADFANQFWEEYSLVLKEEKDMEALMQKMEAAAVQEDLLASEQNAPKEAQEMETKKAEGDIEEKQEGETEGKQEEKEEVSVGEKSGSGEGKEQENKEEKESKEEKGEKEQPKAEKSGKVERPEDKKKMQEREKMMSMDSAARKAYLLSTWVHSTTQYIAQQATVGKDSSLALHPLLTSRYNNSPAIPLPVLHQFRLDMFHSNLMEVICKLGLWCDSIVENTQQKKSAWSIGLTVRKLVYGILCGGGAFVPEHPSPSPSPSLSSSSSSLTPPPSPSKSAPPSSPAKPTPSPLAISGNEGKSHVSVTEHVREGENFVGINVEPTYLLFGKKLPGLVTVTTMQPRIRMALLLDILSSNIAKVADLQEWAFPIAALRAFISAKAEVKSGKLQEWEVMALVLNMVSRPPFSHAYTLRQSQSLPRTREIVHFLAEWQVIIYSSILACSCLLNPVTPPSPAKLYDGEIIIHYLLKCQNKNLDFRKVILKKPAEIELFDKLFAAATEGLEEKIVRPEAKKGAKGKETEEERKKKEIVEKIDRQRNAAKIKEKESVKLNMFDALGDDMDQMQTAQSKKGKKK